MLQSIAHGVILLEKNQAEYGCLRRKLQVSKLRGGPSLEGVHDFAIRPGGLQVFRRMVSSDTMRASTSANSNRVLSTQNAELDRLTGGGVYWGTGVVLVGPAGTGKSTVGIQIISAAAKEGHKSSVFLFDEATANYISRAKNVGLDLSPHISAGRLQVHQIDPNEQSPGEFAYLVRKQVEDGGVRVVVVDSLNGFLTAMTSERFLLAQLHELLSYLNSRSVLTIMTTAQHGMLNTTDTTSFELTYLADLVIYLRYFEASGEVRKAISVIKNRLAAHETSIREFRITAKGLEIGLPLKDFEGILSGIPKYLGQANGLLDPAGDSRSAATAHAPRGSQCNPEKFSSARRPEEMARCWFAISSEMGLRASAMTPRESHGGTERTCVSRDHRGRSVEAARRRATVPSSEKSTDMVRHHPDPADSR